MAVSYRGDAWAEGPARMYDRLAEHVLDAAGVEVRCARVLDVGAGTGAATRAALRRGAHVVATDVSEDMLRYDRTRRPHAVVGDGLALPFGRRAFDVVVACFVVSHVAEPARLFAEMARVGERVVACVFSLRSTHPAKAVIEQVAKRFGYQRPEWAAKLRAHADAIDGPVTLGDAARAGGLVDVRAWEIERDSGLHTPEAIVDWRLGSAALSWFVEQLEPDRRDALRAACVAALAGCEPYRAVVTIAAGTAARVAVTSRGAG